MVFVIENPIWKWMMTGGSPILGNPHIATGWGAQVLFVGFEPH